jgi:adenosylcobinamide-phosphate guanylyltransferase
MLALIMAGGVGSRLNLGEKPLVMINQRPMIAYVIETFEEAGFEPVVVTSQKTPMTGNWCRAQGIPFHVSQGTGYIDDMVESVCALGEKNPLFVSVSDIPCVSAGSLREICRSYRKSCMDACSAWVPALRTGDDSGTIAWHEKIEGIDAVPAGVNILLGRNIAFPQPELKLLVQDPGLAINVNTRFDRTVAENFLRTNKGN